MAKLDRLLQRQILEQLADHYPDIGDLIDPPDADEQDIAANIYYLSEHGLVTVSSSLLMDGTRRLGAPMITAAGMDFLAGDGGLSAILGVVTVKLHDDTIRDIIINRIENTSGDPSLKASLIQKIKSLPAEALGKLTMDGMDAAMAGAPDLLGLLGNIIPKSI